MENLPASIKSLILAYGFLGEEIIIIKKFLKKKKYKYKDLLSSTRKTQDEMIAAVNSLVDKKILLKESEYFTLNYEYFAEMKIIQNKDLIDHFSDFEKPNNQIEKISGDSFIVYSGFIFIRNFHLLTKEYLLKIDLVLNKFNIPKKYILDENNILVLPQFIYAGNKFLNVADILAKELHFINLQKLIYLEKNVPDTLRTYNIHIDFEEVNSRSKKFVKYIKENLDEISEILLNYESYQVVVDEIERTVDLLDNLKENEEYFKRVVGPVTTFLPRNQPLYAFACFAIVPSLMAAEVHVRAPLAMNHFFFDLIKSLKLKSFFPNLYVSQLTREEFLAERSAVKFNEVTGEEEPVTDVVIFTGTMENADKMRQIFSNKVLFIANGAGHNPFIVSENADVNAAVHSAISVQLYNQGQDCANPNSILVHKKKYIEFLNKLKKEVKSVKIGPYINRENTIGSISDPKDLIKIQEVFVNNIKWLDAQTPGVIHTKTSIVEPTIILKPLIDGGNYIEQFAPIFFIQQYEKDQDLSLYFEDPRYYANAMYITVYGDSNYVNNFVNNSNMIGGKIIHDESTIIRNTDLHAPNIERGTKPYGGYGRGASCISIYGKITPKPTLPQRDIFEQLVKPFLDSL